MAEDLSRLLTDLGRSVGQVTGALEAIQQEVSDLRGQHSTMRDRLKEMEVATTFRVEYGGKEHQAIMQRLTTGDGLFTEIKGKAEAALAGANSAKVRINDLRRELEEQAAEADRHRATRARRRMLEKWAPHILAVAGTAVWAVVSWVWSNIHVVALVHDAVKKAGGQP